jgi:hypothetical protein
VWWCLGLEVAGRLMMYLRCCCLSVVAKSRSPELGRALKNRASEALKTHHRRRSFASPVSQSQLCDKGSFTPNHLMRSTLIPLAKVLEQTVCTVPHQSFTTRSLENASYPIACRTVAIAKCMSLSKHTLERLRWLLPARLLGPVSSTEHRACWLSNHPCCSYSLSWHDAEGAELSTCTLCVRRLLMARYVGTIKCGTSMFL